MQRLTNTRSFKLTGDEALATQVQIIQEQLYSVVKTMIETAGEDQAIENITISVDVDSLSFVNGTIYSSNAGIKVETRLR